jgi:hypothetical protein
MQTFPFKCQFPSTVGSCVKACTEIMARGTSVVMISYTQSHPTSMLKYYETTVHFKPTHEND